MAAGVIYVRKTALPRNTRATDEQALQNSAERYKQEQLYEKSYADALAAIATNDLPSAFTCLGQCSLLAVTLNLSIAQEVELAFAKATVFLGLQEFDKSLKQLAIAVQKDPLHLPSYILQVRIYQGLGKIDQAHRSSVVASVVIQGCKKNDLPLDAEQVQEVQATMYQLNHNLAKEKAMSMTTSIAKKEHLPAKSYMNAFFESCQSYWVWKTKVPRLSIYFPIWDRLGESFLLIHRHFYTGNYNEAFQLLTSLTFPLNRLPDYEGVRAIYLSHCNELFGIYYRLLSDYVNAQYCYTQALHYYSSNLTAAVLLGRLLIDFGHMKVAKKLYDEVLDALGESSTILSGNKTDNYLDDESNISGAILIMHTAVSARSKRSVSSSPSAASASASAAKKNNDVCCAALAMKLGMVLSNSDLAIAWIHYHLASYYLVLDTINGQFHRNFSKDAFNELSKVMSLTEMKQLKDAESKSLFFLALLKSIYVSTHQKMTIHYLEANIKLVTHFIEQAEALFPYHHELYMRKMELSVKMGNLPLAKGTLQRFKQSLDGKMNDGVEQDDEQIVNRPSTTNYYYRLCSGMMTVLQLLSVEQTCYGSLIPDELAVHGDIELFTTMRMEEDFLSVLKEEPNSVEALYYYAQFQAIGKNDLRGAVQTLQKALLEVHSHEDLFLLYKEMIDYEVRIDIAQEKKG